MPRQVIEKIGIPSLEHHKQNKITYVGRYVTHQPTLP